MAIWWDDFINTLAGCTKVSPACENCYAIGRTYRFAQTKSKPKMVERYGGLVADGDWTGVVRYFPDQLKRAERKEPTRYFVNGFSDTFHKDVPDSALDEQFDKFDANRQHKYLLCTKRVDRMADYLTNRYSCHSAPHIPDYIYPGCTVENQIQADKRVPQLLEINSPNLWLSIEPLLGNIVFAPGQLDRIAWAVIGRENGTGARECDPRWVINVNFQLRRKNIPVFCKSMPSNVPDEIGNKREVI